MTDLESLLARWRERPLEELVPLVERAARAAQRGRQLNTRTADAEHEVWLATVKRLDPVDLDWLLAHVVTKHGQMARVRIRELLAWPIDPRFGPALLGLARIKPLSTHRPFWTMVFQILKRNAHPRFAAMIEPLRVVPRVTTFDDYLLGKLNELAHVVAQLPPIVATREELAEIAELAAGLDAAEGASPRKTADDFLREIWQSPDDDSLREVFADWLIEHDDPRGEFIALQFVRHRRGLDREGVHRERELLTQHARTWMGTLAPAVHATKYRFERGFLASCTIAWQRLAASPALMIDPAWVTVREFHLANGTNKQCAPWLAHMRALGAQRKRS
jgi:uncharacterized protein (TIGR02996 family)